MTSGILQKNITRNKSISSTHSNSSSKTITLPKTQNSKLSARLMTSSISLDASKVSHDKSIKLLLKSFKKLELGLNKFNSKYNNKSMDIVSSNILRTVLLPFLRSGTLNELLQELSSSITPKVYQSLLSVLTSLLVKWWCTLLNSLVNSNNITSIDRSVYLECVSRIISRPEWINPECKPLIEPASFESYHELLTLTLDYSICKLAPIKHLPLSISAFIGKVFAYSFFKLEGVSHALLFLLNIKQAVFDECQTIFKSKSSDVSLLYDVFPKHLHYLINFTGLQNKHLTHQQKVFLNCLVPPKHPIKGIKEPTGLWVRRWFNSDGDIFNSFLRHYLDITNKTILFSDNPSLVDDSVLLKCPGLNILLTHTYQIFQVSITRISNNTSNTKFTQEYQTIQASNLNPKNNITKQNEVYYNSIFKIFRTLRDMKYNVELTADTVDTESTGIKPVQVINSIIRYIDMMLIDFAEKTTIYDFNRNSLLLNIAYEFINHLDTLNWKFWLNCCYLMLENSDHVQVLLKTLSFLFNSWDLIPEILLVDDQTVVSNNPKSLVWFTDSSESFKGNFTNWLISNRMWERFFIHWSPLVRNYYIRLMVWRVIGVNNFESSSSIKRSLAVEHKLLLSFKVFQQFYKDNKKQRYFFKPENPVVNKKMSIVGISKDEILLNEISNQAEEDEEISNLFNASDFKKTHPFEIFDEAIYSCSRLATDDNNNQESKRSNSLVNSIGKLFKLLSTDTDEDDKEEATLSKLRRNKNNESTSSLSMGSRTVSLTSLSNYSLKSRSSSPSLLSFNSSPTSLTDLSETSSSADSNSTSSSQNPHQSKLFKLPPEIVRPIYKFELIFDQDSIRDKHFLMHGQNYVYRHVDYFGLPEEPRVPSISIYLQPDFYNRFYISTDDLVVTASDHDVQFEDGLDKVLETRKRSDLINLGKSLFEWTSMVEEFTDYLSSKVELEQFTDKEMNEFDYFKRIVPLLTMDSNPKGLNAA